MEEKIISFLKESEGYLSGEEISRFLKITRSGIWKQVQDLRKKGYDIVAVPHLGYKLNSCPDKLFSGEIQSNLGTKILGKKVLFYETATSTMDIAFSLGLEGFPEGTVICAETQTKGRGRLGRHWSSPNGKGIYMSLILRPLLSPNEIPKLTLLTAVAAAEAVRSVCRVDVSIKWPNDLLVDGRKFCGILTELNAEADRVKFVVIGMGFNVNTPLSFLPLGATSLKVESKKTISRVELVKEILRSMEKWYVRFQQEGFSPVVQKWKEYTITLNKRIRVSNSGGYTEGEAVDIDQDGGLLVRQDSGLVIKKMAGDVTLIR